LYHSKDFGTTWTESKRPPAFKKVPEGQKGRIVDHTFWLTPGHASQPGVWIAGTSPQGLFRTEDGGETWEGIAGFNDSSQRDFWCGGDMTPDGAKMHSINIDPRDPRHLYIGMSSGGVMESKDGGATWEHVIAGLEVVQGFDAKDPRVHDPHCMRQHPLNPDRLYQQNHCGIYRLDRPSDAWVRIGRNMPKEVGDIGFPMVLHPRDPDTCWVFPMDGTEVWPRTSPGGKPAAYVTRDAGKTWKRLDKGLPEADAYFTVKRQAMCADGGHPLGLYFGATHGEVWGSVDEGRTWRCLARHLPHIYAVEAALFNS
ncbi:MAG TPA: glycosyl hydrolase, partial [Elusimicrobiota bacterium]|nr:glycosyl hydrolase [Elusimicrobiota bacterium]